MSTTRPNNCWVSLNRELELKKRQAENLIVRSPADGVIVNWQVRKNLLKRPVDRGQNMMTVVDPNGGWQLEIDIPERRVGHLMERLNDSTKPVEVSFALVSHPGQEFTGLLQQIDRKLEVYSDDGNTAKAVVLFDNRQIPSDLLKSGTRINAQLYCGTRSIGFVWFPRVIRDGRNHDPLLVLKCRDFGQVDCTYSVC